MSLGLFLERRRFAATTAAVVFVAVLGALLPQIMLPRLAMTAPVCYSIAALGDFSSALILFAIARTSVQQRAMFVLAFSFLLNAGVMFGCLLVLPLLFGPPIVPSAQQFPVTLFILWHVIVGAGGFAYLLGRADHHRFAWGTGKMLAVASTVSVLLVALIVAGYRYGDRLPVIAPGGRGGLVHTFTGPLVFLLLAGATFFICRLRNATPIERAYGLALLIVTLSFGLFLLITERYTPPYYLGRVMIAASSVLVLVAAVQSLVAARFRLGKVEEKLGEVETQSAKRAARGQALWEICLLPQATESERLRAMLSIAARALRPGLPTIGILAHQAGASVIVDATATIHLEPEADERIRGIVYAGAAFPIAQTMAGRLLAAGRARAWNDLSGRIDGEPLPFERMRCRSFIGIPIEIAGTMHFLEFASPREMTAEPFGDEDLAYTDVLGSFFAVRFKQQQQFERIKFQIEHDALTGLANRALFRTAVREAIRAGLPFAVAIVDVDGFRHLNDRYGHQVGDELLVEIAAELRGAAGPNLAARMSADEFAVLIGDVNTLDETAAAVRRYGELFATPFRTGDRTGTEVLTVSASIGVVRFPVDAASAGELMRRAEVALTLAKSGGGSTTMLFDRSMQEILEANRLRVAELSEAIAGGQLALVYQPTFALASRKVTGAEALLRWHHPERGTLLPAEFIEFAERNGLIPGLSAWTLAHVSEDILASHLPPGFRIFFNLAAPMLDDIPFIGSISAAIAADPSLAEHLGVEVTESAAMQNVERSMNTIALLRGWGLHVAIDDFGTGHSSLAYLKHLTVDLVKIDRSFVAGMPADERDGELLEMLLRIIDRFGIATLAEGIETEAQLTWLLDHGCAYGQGYLLAKPNPLIELLERIGVPPPRSPPQAAVLAGARGGRP